MIDLRETAHKYLGANCLTYSPGRERGKHTERCDTLTDLLVSVAEGERVKYNELLYAVSHKSPLETRHETALRYIRAAEQSQAGESKATAALETK